VSCARACRVAQFRRSAWYRWSRAKDQSALRLRIRDFAQARPRFGFLRIWVLLRRECWLVNRNRVRRLYRLEGLHSVCGSGEGNILRSIVGPLPRPCGQLSAGACILSMIPSRIAARVGFSPSSLTGVGRVPYWKWDFGCRENWWARPEIVP
jgi:transposase InsO family protein